MKKKNCTSISFKNIESFINGSIKCIKPSLRKVWTSLRLAGALEIDWKFLCFSLWWRQPIQDLTYSSFIHATLVIRRLLKSCRF